MTRADERLHISGPVLEWAIERAPVDHERLERGFPRLDAWLDSRGGPTFKQLQRLANLTATPIGYFFLAEPPDDSLPIRDFRTISDRGVGEASADLLDVIRICEARQGWYRDYSIRNGHEPLGFVGSLSLDWTPIAAALEIRSALGRPVTPASYQTVGEAYSNLVAEAEGVGILVMTSGVVGSNTRRRLSVEEFRGFTLVDRYAPTIFVNGADTKSAQIFTLAHEIAHVWLGESGVSNPLPGDSPESQVERWCNAVAAELLVPASELPRTVDISADSYEGELDRLGRRFRVSNLVILRRLHELKRIDDALYFHLYPLERDRLIKLAEGGAGGGEFYNNQPYKVSRRFARAVYADAAEGGTNYRDAFKLLGVKRKETYDKFAGRLGVA